MHFLLTYLTLDELSKNKEVNKYIIENISVKRLAEQERMDRADCRSLYIFIFFSHLHVLNSDVFEDLTVVYIPHRLIIPDFRGQQDGPQYDPLPVRRANIQLGVRQQPLQIYLEQRCVYISMFALGSLVLVYTVN